MGVLSKILAKAEERKQQTPAEITKPDPQPAPCELIESHPPEYLIRKYKSNSIKAIETHCKGYRFRSRLEARWAVCLDAMGIPWDYEREGFTLPSGNYLPDFWLPHPQSHRYPNGGYWLEIKPNTPNAREIALCSEIAKLTGHHMILCYGDFSTGFKSLMFQRTTGKQCDWEPSNTRDDFWIWANVCQLAAFHKANHCSWKEAITAARSARFEHGESPR